MSVGITLLLSWSNSPTKMAKLNSILQFAMKLPNLEHWFSSGGQSQFTKARKSFCRLEGPYSKFNVKTGSISYRSAFACILHSKRMNQTLSSIMTRPKSTSQENSKCSLANRTLKSSILQRRPTFKMNPSIIRMKHYKAELIMIT